MYYNKNLFVNEQFYTQAKRLEKKQLICVICIAVAAVVLTIAVALPLMLVIGTSFPIGYVTPALAAVLFSALFAVIIPISKRLNKLCLTQTEQLKSTVYGEKYAALLQEGKKCEKVSYCLVTPSVVLSVIVSLVLAIIFPYEFYYSYLGFLGTAFVFCLISFIVSNRNRKQIKNMENDLVDFFAKQYELANAEAAAQTNEKNENSAKPEPQQPQAKPEPKQQAKTQPTKAQPKKQAKQQAAKPQPKQQTKK